MNLTLYQVDAFTNRPFTGNPAGVCVLPELRQAEWMQSVAGEMNLAETAFLLPQDDGYNLRWFTPTVEVDLCGHATLASAHILWEIGHLPRTETARFYTRSGLLKARHTGTTIEMDFPAEPPTEAAPPLALLRALGIAPVYVGRNRMDYLVEVDSATTLRNLRPDITLLASVEARGVIVTCRSDQPDVDFLSRFFAPAAGVPEDPVTGSAHCCLGPYWQSKMPDKSEFMAYQASPRGGFVRVRPEGDRVILRGDAVTVLRAELLVD